VKDDRVNENCVEVIHSSDRLEWLVARRTGVGASESAGILGASPWSSGLSIFADKVDPDPPEEISGERLEWGQLLEPVILEYYKKKTERSAWPDGRLLRSTRWPFMLATLDGMAKIEDEIIDLEIKNTQDREGWSEGSPRHVWIQNQHQMAVTGHQKASVGVLLYGCEFKWADVQRDDAFIEEILVPECEKFMALVEAGGPPPQADGTEASRLALKKLFPNAGGETIMLGGEFTEIEGEWEELKKRAKTDKERLTLCENLIKQEIGAATFGALPNGGEFSWKANKNGVRTLRHKGAR
jgi:putative phage-type endonuclease